MADIVEKYGAKWPAEATDIEIEMACIRKGGHWLKDGQACGQGLIYHYEQMRRLLWPELDDHRWHRLCRDEILTNKVTVLMGPGSSGKTHEAAWVYLCEYFVFPDETCVLVCSTDLRGLRLRVWGEIVMLWERARERFDFLPGHLLDAKPAIATDNVDQDARDLRKGIIGVPCVQNGKFVGLSKFLGIKQKRVRLIADEAQFMGGSFLSAFANLDKNVDFRAVVLGNPNETLDPLGKAAEPKDGWSGHLEPVKTSVWNTRFMNGRCVNLIGTDSPNFDFPEGEPTRFKYLISREKIANTLSFFPHESVEYFSQCVGSMKIGVLTRRVLTRDLCRQFGALGQIVWRGTPLVKIGALDAAYGGDRCVGGHVEFGLDLNGKVMLNVMPPQIVPIRANAEPEDQIAEWVKNYCDTNGIPPENFFHDSTGRGSLGTALARVWSAQTNPVEFGGAPSARPVCLDLYIYDEKTRTRRLKLCSEHYLNFVTELWFSVRYAVEAGQVRNLPEDVMEELCMRNWDKVNNHKIQVEPKTGPATKPGMKQRTGRSPDLGDWLAIAVEGARRRGFQISKLANGEEEAKTWDWLDELARKQRQLRSRRELAFT